MKNRTKEERIFVYILLMILLLGIIGVLTACDSLEPPPTETFEDYCIGSDNFQFYEATTTSLIGDGKEWRLITEHGDVVLKDSVYEKASTFEYERICYEVSNLTDEVKYNYAADATTVPEPRIEYVDREVEVEVEVYTHSVIDEDFIAEDGIFFYYIGDDIINLYYKQGLEIYILNILYDTNIISMDQARIASITYFNGVFVGSIEVDTEWQDAYVVLLDGTELEFSNDQELVEWLIMNYSFNEVKASYEELLAGTIAAQDFFREEKAEASEVNE